jgi:DNA polymerase-4
LARTVTIKVRYSDFTTITRSHTAPPTREGSELIDRAVKLLDRTDAGARPVRLLGVSVHNLCTAFTPDSKEGERLPFSDHHLVQQLQLDAVEDSIASPEETTRKRQGH